jgi:hypothetical protein
MPQTDYEQKDNTGILFQEEDRKSDKHPAYTGPLMVNGVMYRMALWPKTSKNGKKCLSVAVTPKTEGGQRPAAAASRHRDQDDIPF